MIEAVGVLFTIILLPFFEHIFRLAGFMSLFAAVAFVAFAHMGFKKFLTVFVILSVILDVTFHLSMGTHLGSLSFSLLILFLLGKIFPSDNLFIKSVVLITSFTIYWIVFSLIFSIQSGTGLSTLTWDLFLSGFVKAIFSTIIYYIGDLLLGYTRGDSKSTLKFK